MSAPAQVFTVGHSTRALDEFVVLLKMHGVTEVIDVRAFPRSRANPRYNIEELPAALAAQGLGYRHMPELGGRRRPLPDSPNTAWRNDSFRGYADYMQTADFQQALDIVLAELPAERPALMCAEAVPWRCHRSLIADALVARGVRVGDILSATRCDPHALRDWAVVRDGRVTYP